jgi:hypothetical protein
MKHLRRLNVQCLEYNTDTYMIFVDFRSAYDCVTEVCKKSPKGTSTDIVTRQGVKNRDGLPPLILV